MNPTDMTESPVDCPTVASTPVLELRSVSKGYGKHPVLNRLNFSVPRGTVVGLLGKNGAGKTTLIRWRWAWRGPTMAPRRCWTSPPGI